MERNQRFGRSFGLQTSLLAILLLAACSTGAHLDSATSGIRRSGAPVSDPAFMGRGRGRAGPEVGAPVAMSGCARPTVSHKPRDLERHEFSEPQMGLPFRLVLYAPDKPAAEAAARAAFGRIQQLNAILSDYEDDSELSRLSRTAGSGQGVRVSDELWFVLQRAQKLAERTDGAFDVTVGPVVSLWRKARREKKLPDAERLARALEAVGHRKMRLDSRRRTVQLLVPRMRLDLGAIAKGYATDEALKVLRRRGITRALVAGGGDMTLGDPPPGKKGWRIEIAPLDTTNAPPARFVLLANAGLATSGDLFQHVEIGGKRYSHIVDPRTGIGLTDHSLVTVIAPDGITADSLATAVSVLGPDKGIKLVEATKGASVHITRLPGNEIEASASRRFKQYYEVRQK